MTKGFQNDKLFLDLDVYILLFIIDYNDYKITKCSNFIFGLRYPGCFLHNFVLCVDKTRVVY